MSDPQDLTQKAEAAAKAAADAAAAALAATQAAEAAAQVAADAAPEAKAALEADAAAKTIAAEAAGVAAKQAQDVADGAAKAAKDASDAARTAAATTVAAVDNPFAKIENQSSSDGRKTELNKSIEELGAQEAARSRRTVDNTRTIISVIIILLYVVGVSATLLLFSFHIPRKLLSLTTLDPYAAAMLDILKVVILPVVTFMIGYYFGTATSEARQSRSN
jgi:cobalamin biosynthesis Mg chelatase CobN